MVKFISEGVEIDFKFEQAGAELSQAQGSCFILWYLSASLIFAISLSSCKRLSYWKAIFLS